MKPSARVKSSIEARATYDKVIEIFFYFRPVEELDEVVHPKFLGYGTAAHEFFKDREALRNMAVMQAEQLRDTQFTLTRKPVIEKFLTNDSTFLILEDFELHMQDNDHILQLRLSTILEKDTDKWVITHFHGSTPDKDIDEEEAFPMEGLRKKNAELEAKIKERTRELEIEAALERVRSRSMAMHKSSEIGDVAFELYQQLKSLGGDLWGTGFAFCKPDSDADEFWFANQDGIMPHLKIPNNVDEAHKLLYDGWKNNLELLSVHKSGKELKDHYKYMLSVPDVAPIFQGMLDSGLKFPEAQTWYAGYFKFGYLLVITIKPYEHADNFKRFAKVFEQAYTRFLDLQKAEQQAREAQIEAALEKVRTASMAMQKGEELAKVISVVFAQLKALGIDSEGCTLNLYDKEEGMDIWMSGFGEDVHPRSFHISYFDHPYYRMQLNDWKNGEKYKVLAFEGDLKKSYDEQTFSNKDFFELPKDIRKEFLAKERKLSSAAYMKYGMLEMIGDEALSDSQGDILCRFAKVFEQAYTRFLDIQQAEAQAREAQIETALERVRSRSMGMQKSEELKDVVKVIFDQLAHLSINAEHAGIVVDYEPKKDWHFWIAETQDIPAKVTVPYLDLLWDRQFTEAKKKGKDFFTTLMDFEEKNSFYKVLLPHVEGLTKKVKDFYFSCPGLAISTAIEKDIGLYIENFSGTPYSSEENDILRRFAKVFQQTYTRFLDLKKAEAQAREAQIETALERVRSRSMAMHKSEELADLSLELVKQVQALGVDTWFCAFNIYDDESKGSLEWGSNGQGTFPKYRTPREGIFLRYYEAGKKGETLLINEIGEDECPAHYDYLCTLPGVGEQLLKMKDEGIPFPTSQIDHVAFFKYGYVLFITYEPSPESHEIFKRFAKVFEQTYTRFLDLQKAEAQAKEAQIEVALEKVRSQSLAMHTTSEMQLVANAVYDQLQELGVVMDAVGMSGVIEEKKDYDVWIGGAPMGKALRIPYNKDTKVQRDYNKAIKKRPDLFARTYSGKVKEEYVNHLLTHGDFPKDLKRKMVTSSAFSTSISFAKNSSIQIARYTNNQYTAEENEILKRFSKVFEQAYIRFMDLQKAEKQAREAQIESSLERVRARSMAMHASDELNDVLSTLFQQFDVLGIKPVTAFLSLFDIENNTFTYRSTSKAGNRMQTQQVVDLNSMEIWQEMAEKWKKDKQDSLEVIYYSPEILPQLFDLFEETFSAMPEEERMTIADYPNGGYSMHGYCKFGYIGYNHIRLPTDEEKEILIKFATEFGRVYQRFLDIKKAEAQAKEAQIEAALEKVRSSMMAMHKTEELHLVLKTLFEQMQSLGLEFQGSAIIIYDENLAAEHWMIGFSGEFPESYKLPYSEHPYCADMVKAWQKGVPFQEFFFEGELKVEYGKWALENSDFKHMPPEFKKEMLDPARLVLSEVFNKYGMLEIMGHEPLQKETVDILKRFSKVFEQSYTRFLDLKKAEAQAKEAQIEAALEKVRSASLAMHQSKDLHNVLVMLYNQLDALGLKMHSAQISESIEDPKAIHSWIVTNGAVYPEQVHIPFSKNIYFKRIREAVTNGESFYTLKLSKQQKDKHFHHIFDNSSLKNVPQERKDLIFSSPGLGTSNAMGKYTSLSIMRYDGILYSEEENEIIKRFAKVFEQSYTRFLDIQKAESQAKEAQIEAALEKVRSRSMAMHNSSEMLDVIEVVSGQLRHLNLDFDTVSFATNDQKGTFNFWMTSRGQPKPIFMEIPHLNNPVINRVYEAKKNNETFISDVFSAAENKEWTKHLIKNSDLKNFPEPIKKFILNAPGFARSSFFLENIDLYLVNYRAVPFAEEDNLIFQRFAKVFEQAYTRFLDLQKAEARIREAQIEAALEKVRSRTMAMHKSQELHKVILTVSQEIRNLGLNISAAHLYRFEEGDKGINMWVAGDGGIYPNEVYFPYFKHQFFDGIYHARTTNKTFFTMLGTSKKEKNRLYRHLLNSSKIEISEDRKKYVLDAKSWAGLVALGKYSGIGVLRLTEEVEEEFSVEEYEILKRLSKVFEQAYIRFMDLEKAEAQAREAQIEVAMERVRSRAMAMHHTDELTDVLGVLFDQFDFLGINPVLTHLTLFDEENETFTLRITTGGEKRTIAEQLIDVNAVESWKTSFANWKKSELHAVDCIDYPPEVLPAVWEVLDGVMSALPEGQKIFPEDFPNGLYTTQGHCKYGYIGFNHSRRATEEEKEIVIRFAKEFGRLYQRFLDIQKAEAQAREAQIEAALEKVRSASLAMHQSKDLHDVLVMLYNQLASLGLKMHSAQIIESIDDFKELHCWIVTNGVVYPEQVHAPFTKNIFFKRFREAVTNGESFYTLKFSKRQKDNLFQHFFDNTIIRNAPQARKDLVLSSPGLGTSNAIGKYTSLSIMRYDGILYSEEENEIIKRFLKVFEQSYRRFLDLQKAESQAREAQIEAALERVRSKAMAMHSSDDLADTVEILYKELDTLQVHALRFGHAKVILDTKIVELHTATDLGKVVGQVKLEGHPLLEKIYEHFLAKEDLYYALQGEEMKSYYSILGRAIDVPIPTMDTVQHGYFFFLGDTANYAWSDKALDEEELKVYRRLITVLNLTYKRYEELKNAESQAREAQIEGALERVRSKTMAMHNSEDLEDIVVSLFDEVMNLGLDKSIRCGIGILEGHEGMETRSVNKSSDGTVDLKVGMLNMTIHPMLVGLKKAWKNGRKSYSYEYNSKDVRKYYTALNKEPEYPFNADLTSLPNQEYHRSFFYSSGIIFAFSENPISEESSKILARFAAVFGQTYQRFLDLQKAEERAKDAIKQASLDRVRGQIASMRSTEDLEQITPLVWNELKALGIPFIRCGVFIIDESSKTVQAFLSAPDGHSLGVMKIPFDAEKVTAATVANWKKKEVYKTHWDKDQFLEFMQLMKDLGQVSNEKEYQGAEQPPESLHLHFVPFTQGMLYVGNVGPLEDEQIELIQTLADAFAIAYARYEDFVKLEKAKEQVENTLEELKATQNQLVQSEKMASLGELTAGIAHEIQNPLNFVNNFSEVSVELLEEMLEEMSKGDLEEAKALMEDIKQNLDKINHHGKRADGIVKGMLQHSRTSSGEKELTDLNVLADEYLRLAYHGLRAKDKTFNATLETHFDESIGKVNILAQDMGRVILNLITNAFYAVKEKSSFAKASEDDTYEPTVTVSTKKKKNSVEISVKDNGNGIPKEIKEKIFQPFFTTKPTGQGTGLGLSMSYDIVTKGHGGSLKVETEEGKGTTFCINLPVIK